MSQQGKLVDCLSGERARQLDANARARVSGYEAAGAREEGAAEALDARRAPRL